MIFFRADGRLGNQAFQYAFLNSVAKPNEKIICLDMSQFETYFSYGNKNFIFFKTTKLIRFLYKFFFAKVLVLMVKLKLIGCIEQLSVDESFIPKVKVKDGFMPFRFVRLGFFQSENLFSGDKVDFNLKQEYRNKAEVILQALPKQEKVFVHVRRGDYINVNFRGERGIELPKSYFIDAIEEIKRRVKKPFFIFLTDDPGYVRDCFSEIDEKYISEEDMATDLAIMSLCKYGIVSNSSFSWWGAYLSSSKELMIFPKYWYGWKRKVESHEGIQPTWSTVIDVKKFNE